MRISSPLGKDRNEATEGGAFPLTYPRNPKQLYIWAIGGEKIRNYANIFMLFMLNATKCICVDIPIVVKAYLIVSVPKPIENESKVKADG